MRQFNPLFQEQLNRQYGSEPMVFVEVEWVEGSTISYSDRKIGTSEYPKPTLVRVSDVATSATLTGSASNTQISVVLDDTDGDIQEILNNHDVHGRPAKISIGFQGLDFQHRETFVSGVVASPMEYDEASKSFSFDILSEFNTREVAFAMEDGDFPFIPEDQRNKVWPLVFGEVCHMPTVQISTLLQGRLKEGVGVKDPTLDGRLCQAKNIRCPRKRKLVPLSQFQQGIEAVVCDPDNTTIFVNSAGVEVVPPGVRASNPSTGLVFGGCSTRQILQFYEQSGIAHPHLGSIPIYDADGRPLTSANCDLPVFDPGISQGDQRRALEAIHENLVKFELATCRAEQGYVQVAEDDTSCQTRRLGIICQLTNQVTQQEALDSNQMQVAGGEDFPQNQTIIVRVDNIRFQGVMNGEVFTISDVFPPEEIDNPPCIEFSEGSQTGNSATPVEDPADCVQQLEDIRSISGGASESFRYFESFDSIGFKWLPPGSIVTLEDSNVVVHIASLHPATVNSVAAYRTLGPTRVLMELPADRYTVEYVNYGGYTTTEIHLVKALSTYPDETWDETIYVSLTSTIPVNLSPSTQGSNVAGVIKTLVELYTDLTIDTDSFLAVEQQTENYPMNFYINRRRDVLSIIRDIAYQARCAVSINDGVVKLTYLSAEPTESRVLSDDDLLLNSFKVSLTESEDLITRHNIEWKRTDAPINSDDEAELELVLRHNVSRYGTVESSFDFFGLNIFELVQKTGTFWLIRRSNTWKMVEFETPMKHLDLELYDSITLQIDEFPAVKCIIQEMDYNQEANSIRFKCWTPVLSGTDEEYIWGYPATQDEFVTFPLQQVDDAGDGLDIEVRPPNDHPLAIGFTEQRVFNTSGDRLPSDEGDTFAQVVCDEATEFTVGDTLEPEILDFELSGDVSNAALDDLENSIINDGNRGNIEDENGNTVDDPTPEPEDPELLPRFPYVLEPPAPPGFFIPEPAPTLANPQMEIVRETDPFKHFTINGVPFGLDTSIVPIARDPEPLAMHKHSHFILQNVNTSLGVVPDVIGIPDPSFTPEITVTADGSGFFFPASYRLSNLSTSYLAGQPFDPFNAIGLANGGTAFEFDQNTPSSPRMVYLYFAQPNGQDAFARRINVLQNPLPQCDGFYSEPHLLNRGGFTYPLGPLQNEPGTVLPGMYWSIPYTSGLGLTYYVQRYLFNDNATANAFVSDVRDFFDTLRGTVNTPTTIYSGPGCSATSSVNFSAQRVVPEGSLLFYGVESDQIGII